MNETVYINSFSIENFRKFDNEVKLNFLAEQKKYNKKETLNIFQVKNQKKYYNSAVGIIGKNAAGKSTIFTALNLYFNFNDSGPYYNTRELTPFGVRQISSTLINNFDFNNNKPIKFEINISTSKYDFIHIVIFTSSTFFKERIYVIKNKKPLEIFNQDSNNNNKYNFFRWYSLLSSQPMNTKSLAEEQIAFGQALNKLLRSTFIFNSQTYKDKFLQEASTEIYLTQQKSKTKENECVDIQKKIDLILSTIDNNIIGVSFKKALNSFNQEILVLDKAKLKNEKQIPIDLLSSGTFKFLSKILSVFRWSEEFKNSYIFIDELDNSWHPRLAQFFIKLFQDKIFNNVTLVFTAHNPYIFNQLRKDAIYFFDEKNKLTRFNEYKTADGKNIRNDYIFSKNYFDEKIGSAPNEKELNLFCKEINKKIN